MESQRERDFYDYNVLIYIKEYEVSMLQELAKGHIIKTEICP